MTRALVENGAQRGGPGSVGRLSWARDLNGNKRLLATCENFKAMGVGLKDATLREQRWPRFHQD